MQEGGPAGALAQPPDFHPSPCIDDFLKGVCILFVLRCREEGLLALWRGWLPSVIGVVPYVGLNFGVYETLKDVIIKMYGE